MPRSRPAGITQRQGATNSSVFRDDRTTAAPRVVKTDPHKVIGLLIEAVDRRDPRGAWRRTYKLNRSAWKVDMKVFKLGGPMASETKFAAHSR